MNILYKDLLFLRAVAKAIFLSRHMFAARGASKNTPAIKKETGKSEVNRQSRGAARKEIHADAILRNHRTNLFSPLQLVAAVFTASMWKYRARIVDGMRQIYETAACSLCAPANPRWNSAGLHKNFCKPCLADRWKPRQRPRYDLLTLHRVIFTAITLAGTGTRRRH